MKKLNFFFKTFLTVSILCSSVSMQGMEVDSYSSTSKYNEKYNNNHCLLFTMIHPEILPEIFSQCVIENDLSVVSDLSVVALPCPQKLFYFTEVSKNGLATAGAKSEDQIKSLKDGIKTLMKLSCVCKKFNGLLTHEKIGNFCKKYTQENKNKTLQNLLTSMSIRNEYNIIHSLALILVHAGADANTPIHFKTEGISSLLEQEVARNDAQSIAILFKHHANPNVKTFDDDPVFFFAKTTEIAQLFIDHGADLNIEERSILWEMLYDKYPADLIPFYIQHGADLLQKCSSGGCLLHQLAEALNEVKSNDNHLEKAKFLLNTLPNKINSLDDHGQTPLDIAKRCKRNLSDLWVYAKRHPECSFYRHYPFSEYYIFAKKFIALLKEHGALTSKEVKREKSGCTIS